MNTDTGKNLLGMLADRESSSSKKVGAWRSLVSALRWGCRGRRFKSSRPDHLYQWVTGFTRNPLFVWVAIWVAFRRTQDNTSVAQLDRVADS